MENKATRLESVATELESIPTQREESTSFERSSLEIEYFQDYKIVKQLPTKGVESDIYIVEKEKQSYILKLYRLGIEPKEEIFRQLQSLSTMHPKDVVQIYEVGFDKNLSRWFEIQEYIANGSLQEFREVINGEKLYIIIQELLSILHTLHSNKIIHRDLKPDNILIRSYSPLNLIISDFGISSLLKDASSIWTSKQGTHRYFAPESFSGVIGTAVDYWSLGMIIYELTNGGKHYFSGVDNDATIQLHITTKNIEIPDTFDENIVQLLGFLFRINPENRGDYVLVQKWLRGENIGTPTSDEKAIEEQEGYPFEGKHYSDFNALAKTVSLSYKNWKLWGNHLENEHLLEWAKRNQQYDKYTLIDNLRNENQDLMVLSFIHIFNPEIENFQLFGKSITLNNFHLFAQKYHENSASEEEKKIYRYLIEGKIKKYYLHYLQLKNKEDKYSWIFDEISNYIDRKKEDGFSQRVIFKFLDFLNHQVDYFLPLNIEELSIDNFHYLIKKEELKKSPELSFLFERFKYGLSIENSKKIKKILSMNLDNYYYPNDFFDNLKDDLEKILLEFDFFVKKSTIEDIEKRYYIPMDSPYFSYVEKIKNAKSKEYIKAYEQLKLLKQKSLLLKIQLEEAKEETALFKLFDIDINQPSTHELKIIKKVLSSNIDSEIYKKVKSIHKNNLYEDLKEYLSKVEKLEIKINNEDGRIVNFIKYYRLKLYAVRTVYFITLTLMLVILPFYQEYLLSFIVAFGFMILFYILIINRIVRMPITSLNRIGSVSQVHYEDSKELPNNLIKLDNILIRFIVIIAGLLASFGVLYLLYLFFTGFKGGVFG